jgi:outer membrane protein
MKCALLGACCLLFLSAGSQTFAVEQAPQEEQKVDTPEPKTVPASEQPQSTAPQTAQPSRTLTQAEAEAIAIKSNPQITIGKLRALIALQYVREVRSLLMPTVVGDLTAVDAEPGSRITAGLLNNPALFPRAAGGVFVSQLISDFGRTTNLLSSSKYRAKAEDENSVATIADIKLAVDRAFYGALEDFALLKVAEETVKARQVSVDKIDALLRSKLKSEVDLSFAKVDLARAQLLQLEAQNNFQASLASLSALLGYPDEQNFQLAETPQELASPAPAVEPLIAEAFQQRPELAALQAEVTASEKNARAEHDLWMPTISALGAAGGTPVRDDHITPNWYGAAGVNVQIPLFNGFLYNARAKAADLQTDVVRQQLSDQRNTISRDVRISWQGTQEAFARLAVTRQLEEQANLALDLATQRYNLGLGSIVELSQAQLGKTEADIAQTDARYQYRLSQLILAYTTASTP